MVRSTRAFGDGSRARKADAAPVPTTGEFSRQGRGGKARRRSFRYSDHACSADPPSSPLPCCFVAPAGRRLARTRSRSVATWAQSRRARRGASHASGRSAVGSPRLLRSWRARQPRPALSRAAPPTSRSSARSARLEQSALRWRGARPGERQRCAPPARGARTVAHRRCARTAPRPARQARRRADRALGDLLPLVTDGDHARGLALVLGTVVDRKTAAPATLSCRWRGFAAAADNFGAAREVLGCAAVRRTAGEVAAGVTACACAQLATANGDADAALPAAREAGRLIRGRTFTVAETLVELSIAPEEAHRELERLWRARQRRRGHAPAWRCWPSAAAISPRRSFAGSPPAGEGAAEALFYLGVIAERRATRACAAELPAAAGGSRRGSAASAPAPRPRCSSVASASPRWRCSMSSRAPIATRRSTS